MGAWGPGLWSDDTACDVRATYREALEDGLDDAEARAKVESEFASDLEDDHASTLVWLALAASQSRLGRLDDDVRERAIQIIDSGANLRMWEGDPVLLRKRRATLAKLQAGLLGPQPDRKRVKKPSQPKTTLTPGDVLAFSASSGRTYLLAVRALSVSRYGTYPVVRLLEFMGPDVPDAEGLQRLQERPRGRPTEPWFEVDGIVTHKRGEDYADSGFRVVGHVDAPSVVDQEGIKVETRSYMGWPFWSQYFENEGRFGRHSDR